MELATTTQLWAFLFTHTLAFITGIMLRILWVQRRDTLNVLNEVKG